MFTDNYCKDMVKATFIGRETTGYVWKHMDASKYDKETTRTTTRLSCFNVKTNWFILRKLISLVRLKRISSLG